MKKNKEKVDETLLLKSQLVRTLADYDNLRKRVEKEKETWLRFAGERILIKLLAIYEEEHEAIETVEGNEEGKIAEVVLSGWKFKDGPVIRHAKVKVFDKINK